jgi:excisionase family DNA binding protein
MKNAPPLDIVLALSPQQVAQRIGISERIVRDMMKRGELPVILVRSKRKVRLTDLEAWLAAQPVLLPGELGHAS